MIPARLRPVITQTAGLLTASTLIALTANILSPAGIPVTRALTLRELDARYLTFEETLARHQAGQTMFLDARRTEHFERGHLPGAQSLPADEFDNRFEAIAAWLPKEAELVIYCEGKSCSLGRQLADKLATVGYSRVFIFRDGWAGWLAGHGPAER
jgi:rhodanese-related sulfurtransferase